MSFTIFTEEEFNRRIRNGKGKFIKGERWAFISDCDWDCEINSLYHVSDYGRIMYNLSFLYNRYNYINHYKGYTQVSIGNKIFYLHRLVAFYFVENPDSVNCKYVNHKDLNKKNNHYSNLEWVTAKMNSQHYWNLKRIKNKVVL
jgi:hypothetical protein